LPINFPQIISESDFEMAQERRIKNCKLSSRNTKEFSLLQGVVICGECGQVCYKRTKKWGGKTHGYYYCSSKLKKSSKCSNASIGQENLDKIVFEEVLALLSNPQLIREEMTRRASEASNIGDIYKREVSLKKDLSNLQKEQDRLLDAYQEGIIDLDELKSRNLMLGQRKRALDAESKSIQALKFNSEQNLDLDAVLNSLVNRMRLNSNDLSIQEKRKVIRLLVESVTVHTDKVVVTHCISPRLFADEMVLLGGECQMSRFATRE